MSTAPGLSTHRQLQPPRPFVATQPSNVSFDQLFRFASTRDQVLMVIGSICAGLVGVSLPVFSMFWGQVVGQLADQDSMVQKTRELMLRLLYLGIGTFFASWGMLACWSIAGEHQGISCRQEYLRSVLRQEPGWFDTNNQLQMMVSFTNDIHCFQEALNEKLSNLISVVFMLVGSIVISFIHSWVLTLVMLSIILMVLVGGAIYSAGVSKNRSFNSEVCVEAGALAEEGIMNIRTVKMLNGEAHQSSKYASVLERSTQNACRLGFKIAIGEGIIYGSYFCAYSLCYWFGSHCVQGSSVCPPSTHGGEAHRPEDVFIVFFCMFLTVFSLMQTIPTYKKIQEGRVAAAKIYQVIDRQPLISSVQEPVVLPDFKGVFRFENVSFAYPSSKETPILNQISFQVNAKSTAIVGTSGCGKSTLLQLMMRFYDPDEGSITLDGVDLRVIDLTWLRSKISFVKQQPALFSMSILENLKLGNSEVSEEAVRNSLQQVGLYQWTVQPELIRLTQVGSAGSKVSGGQKQRLAIVRALLRRPQVLLLDEVTSALDHRSQQLVLHILNALTKDTRLISVAHQKRMIESAEWVISMDRRAVTFEGTHEQYCKFVSESKQALELPSMVQLDKNPSSLLSHSLSINKKASNQLSLSAQKIADEEQRNEGQFYPTVFSTFSRNLSAYCESKTLYFFCLFLNVIIGATFPVSTIFIGKYTVTILTFSNNTQQSRKDANLYSLIFLLLAVSQFVVYLINLTLLNSLGQEIVLKMRKQIYLKILRMPVPWFSNASNSSSRLAALLTNDTYNIKSFLVTFIKLVVENTSTLVGALIVALIYEWRTALASLGLLPLILLAGIFRSSFADGAQQKANQSYKTSQSLLSEAVLQIKTVQSLNAEDSIFSKSQQLLVEPLQLSVTKAHISGLLYGLSQLLLYFSIGLIFFLGSLFLKYNNIETEDVLIAIYSMVVAGLVAGSKIYFMPEYSDALLSEAQILRILTDIDEDQRQIADQSPMLTPQVKGDIAFQKVNFSYATGKGVFEELNLSIKQGERVGVVGQSGSGKSTLFSLLCRFYEIQSGSIKIDGINIKDFDIHYLRSCLGLVSQQPVLFNDTVASNVRYNLPEIPNEKIEEALKLAEFHLSDSNQELIDKDQSSHVAVSSHRKVGPQGSQLSGGQKQRVAIARTMIRQPRIILLDEINSALDNTTAEKVQASIDALCQGKTAVFISHQTRTISHWDRFVQIQGLNAVQKMPNYPISIVKTEQMRGKSQNE